MNWELSGVERALFKKSLAEFVKAGWHVLEPETPLLWNWHLDAICRHVQALIEDAPGTPQNLLMNVPPGTMKSLVTSVFLPAWVWLKRPSWRACFASGTPAVVTRDSMKCRALIKSQWYQETFKPAWQISKDQDEKHLFSNTAGGFRQCVGAGGVITGVRADCLATGTMVATAHGGMPIELVREGDLVWSYSETKGIELNVVQATRKVVKEGGVRVVTGEGAEIRCTHDHLFYTQRGYVRAVELTPGDTLLCMREEKAQERKPLLEVPRGTLPSGSCAVQCMPGCGVPLRARRGEDAAKGEEGSVLLQEVSARGSSQTHEPRFENTGSEVRGVWEGCTGAESQRESKEGHRESVLHGRLSYSEPNAGPEGVQGVSGVVRGAFVANSVLLKRVQEHSPQQKHEGVQQFSFSSSDVLQQSTQTDARAGHGERSVSVRKLLGQSSPVHAPHRPDPDKQSASESGYAVRGLPSKAPSFERIRVALVERVRCGEVEYHDLQVAGNHNFFAEGVLVHNCLLVDDPNDAREVHSKAHRVAINERWWDAAWHNRIADPAKSKRIVIMQRLHEEDLSGYLLEKEGSQWTHLCLPMEFEPGRMPPTWLGWTDPRTTEGELLFPKRFPADYLVSERLTLGSAGYAGQMQQRPTPAAGNRFQREWWRFWSPTGEMQLRPKGTTAVPPKRFNPAVDKYDDIVASWDCSFKDGDENDFVVGITVYKVGALRYVVERYRKKAGLGDTIAALRQQVRDWRPWEVLVEDKANGTAVVELLQSEIDGILPVNPMGGKEARAAVLEPKVEAGQWLLPEGASWLDEWIDEFASFPLGKNDDQVDAASQLEVRLLEDSEVSAARSLLGLRA